eukprot:1087068-Rhodomonas_salina.3
MSSSLSASASRSERLDGAAPQPAAPVASIVRAPDDCCDRRCLDCSSCRVRPSDGCCECWRDKCCQEAASNGTD